MISKDKYISTMNTFKNIKNETSCSKWMEIKKQIKMVNKKTPVTIIENDNIHRSPISIAKAMNRLYIQEVKKTINQIPKSNIDPLVHYKAKIDTPVSKFHFKIISMSDFKKVMNKMKKLWIFCNRYNYNEDS